MLVLYKGKFKGDTEYLVCDDIVIIIGEIEYKYDKPDLISVVL